MPTNRKRPVSTRPGVAPTPALELTLPKSPPKLLLNFSLPLAFVGAFAVFGVVGCGTDNSDQGNVNTGGTGTGGTDTGTDTVPINTDTTPLQGGNLVNLMPNEQGFMETGENELGIQGAWYTFGCDGAVVNPVEGSEFTNTGKMCFSGTAPIVTDIDSDGALDYSIIWGAGMGFDLCAESAEEAADAGIINDAGVIVPTKYPLSACPYNAELVTKMIGVSVRFSGVVNAQELRIQFNEGDNIANSYYKVDPADVAAGTVISVEFEDPMVKTWYDRMAKPGDTNANNVLAIQFMIPTNAGAPVDWDFCVEDVAAIIAL